MEKSNLEELLDLAAEGRRKWLELEEQYGITYGTIAYIMPHQNSRINVYAVRHSQDMLHERRADRLVIICTEEDKEAGSGQITGDGSACSIPENAVMVTVNRREMEALLKYYDMTEFSSQVILLSFDYGSDCSAAWLAGYRGITEEELVCTGLLGIKA